MNAQKVITATSFEVAALLQSSGYRFVGPRVLASGRIVLEFSDPIGEGMKLIRKHEREGVPVNSLAFEQGMRWAKDKIFAARREAEAGE